MTLIAVVNLLTLEKPTLFNRLKKIFSAAEAKSLSQPTLEELTLFSGIVPGSFAVSASTALRVPSVSAAIRTISEAAATLAIKVVRIEGKVETDEPDHHVAKFLKSDVNDWTSPFELIRDLVAQALTQDTGGLAWVNRVNRKPVEVIHYQPGQMSVTYSTSGEPSYRLGNVVIKSADVIHVRGPFTRCALSLASEVIGVALVMEQRAAKLFQNAARPSGVIEFPSKLDADAFARMKDGWTKAHEAPESSGKTAILWDGAKFNALAFSSVDAQFLELRRFTLEEIARAFNIPSPMIGDLTRATWSNLETKNREFLSYTLEPWLRILETALTRALFTTEERGIYAVRFDRDDLSRVSLTERATAINSLIASRTINPNTGRDWLGLEPYTGGEEYLNPNVTAAPATGATANG